jgi:FAD/FMN-containing dehydrogenase
MPVPDKFIELIKQEFPDDRLTYQKSVATFHPESAEEASRLFRLANKQRQPLFITGFGNNIDPIDKPFTEMISVRTDRLNKLLEVVPDDFYITVGAGYPLREINSELQAYSLWLPHSALPYVGSVGGSLAAGLNADHHEHDLPLKKYFIKGEIVTPEGEIIKPGSVCFKSVSGYDIVKIFAGSWGLLGLIVSASFRVMPLSGASDYTSIKQKEISRDGLLKHLDESNGDSNALYSRKIKAKFDPNGILPVV